MEIIVFRRSMSLAGAHEEIGRFHSDVVPGPGDGIMLDGKPENTYMVLEKSARKFVTTDGMSGKSISHVEVYVY